MFGKGWATRHRLGNGRYPGATICWEWDEHGWKLEGKIQCWANGDEKMGRVFHVTLGQASPLGHLHADVEPMPYGAWAFILIPGLAPDERDLVWCGEWALATLQTHPDWAPIKARMEELQDEQDERRRQELRGEIKQPAAPASCQESTPLGQTAP